MLPWWKPEPLGYGRHRAEPWIRQPNQAIIKLQEDCGRLAVKPEEPAPVGETDPEELAAVCHITDAKLAPAPYKARE